MAAGGGMQVVPKEKCVRVNGGDALRTGGYVCQRVAGGRGNDLVEESKNIKLGKVEVFAAIEVGQNIKAGPQ